MIKTMHTSYPTCKQAHNHGRNVWFVAREQALHARFAPYEQLNEGTLM